jgi:hypothetical protein
VSVTTRRCHHPGDDRAAAHGTDVICHTVLKNPLKVVAPVFADPSDLALRSVVADALLEHQHPWGTLIAAQLGAKKGPAGKQLRASESEMLAEHLEDFVGPIAQIASLLPKKKCLELANGFLDVVRLDKRKVPREAWVAAAKAPHWATVRVAEFSVLTTPIWFVSAWSKNPAATRSLRELTFSGMKLERNSPSDGWILSELRRPTPYGTALAAFVSGLPKPERARMAFAPRLAKKHRAWAIAAVRDLRTSLR